MSTTDPAIAGLGCALPDHRLDQHQCFEVLRTLWDERGLEYDADWLAHFFESVGVDQRHVALPPGDYRDIEGFGDSNDHYIEVGTDLGTEAVERALDDASIPVSDLEAIFTTTVTGVASPSLDAKIVNELGLGRQIRRTPMFGLGCVGGAAGLGRMSDYLRAHPDHAAALVAIEPCSLTVERHDPAIADYVAAAIFGDGAMAAVGLGGEHPGAEASPRVVDSHRILYPDTEWVMGWEIDGTGFNLVLSGDLPEVVERELRPVVDEFLGGHGLTVDEIDRWIAHPGGPAVLEAMGEALDLDDGDLASARASLREVGNLSSASVLHVMQKVYEQEDGGASRGPDVAMAMGPGFSAEFVLLDGAHR